jgi:predicted nucleotidyltransferase component of viral defense system
VNDWPWRSPEATRQALTERIGARFEPAARNRRLAEIAFRRLLFRLFTAQPDRWVVKGGAALLLRLDPNRTSIDIDLAYVDEAGEHAVALKALREAIALDAGDFFSFEIGTGRMVDPEHAIERAFSVPVVARLGAREFARFSVDLALPQIVVDVERVEASRALTGAAAVDELPPLQVLSFASQVADKVCAMFERHGANATFSSRARDLADIAMIAAQVDFDGARLEERLRAEETRRIEAGTLLAALPAVLVLPDDQARDWRARWRHATRNAPIEFAAALVAASAFLDPVLSGRVGGLRWRADTQSWS